VEVAISRNLREVLRGSEDEASRLNDDYVSTEHLLLAVAESKGPAADVMKTIGLSREKLLSALTQIRGTQRLRS
jgi:ATP-dependent Clp protease ATP-binding subunit ClpB